MASTSTQQPPKSFDILQLPSIKAGMTAEEEATKRRKTCRFIEEAGRLLKLPRVPVATAMVFFHRFYAKHSFLEHDRFEVAVACLVLAAKTEESPKKLNAVIEESYKLKQRGMNGMLLFIFLLSFVTPKLCRDFFTCDFSLQYLTCWISHPNNLNEIIFYNSKICSGQRWSSCHRKSRPRRRRVFQIEGTHSLAGARSPPHHWF